MTHFFSVTFKGGVLRRFSKIAAVALVASMTLAGCGNDDNGGGGGSAAEGCDAGGDGSKVGIAYDVGGRGDRSFNDSAWAGMEKAIDELDASCTEAKAAAGENDTQREERLRTLADQGFNPVVAVGFIYSPAAAKVAAEFPDTNFAVIDGYSQFLTGDEQLENLVDLTFAEEQGSYLVGVAAALKTKAKHVGFVGGTHGDLIKKFEAGFTAGVESVDPSIKVEVKYLTEDPNDGKTGFENPAGGKTRRRGPARQGRRRDLPRRRQVGQRRLRGRRGRAARATWRSASTPTSTSPRRTSQKPFILTSMLKRIDTAVFDYIKANDDGESPSGNVTYDLASLTASATPPPVVSWTTSRTRSTLPPSRSRAARSRCPRLRPADTLIDTHHPLRVRDQTIRLVPGSLLLRRDDARPWRTAPPTHRRRPRHRDRQAIPGRHRQPRHLVHHPRRHHPRTRR